MSYTVRILKETKSYDLERIYRMYEPGSADGIAK